MNANKKDKIAIVVDSFSSLNKAEADDLGIFFAPLRITIDGTEYRDGIDMEPEALINLTRESKDIKTSAVTPGDFALAYKNAIAAGYNKIIVIPCSKGFSITSENAKLAAQDLGDQVIVFDESILTCTATKGTVKVILKMLKNGANVAEVRTYFRKVNKSQELLVIPKNLDALRRGGRIPKSLGAIMNLLRIIPIIGYDGKNHKLKTTRTHTKAIEWSLNWIKEKIGNTEGYNLSILCTNSKLIFVQNLLKDARNTLTKNTKISLDRVSALIAAHTGYDSIGLLIYKL